MKVLKSIFKFFSSVKLAIVVLLALAYVLALGTIYESLYGTAVAKEKVYGTVWFTLVLTFLGINVLCAALSRLPWKRHHIGFVVTHAGILVILAGSLITQRFGLDGSMAIAEGDRDDRITLDDPLLQVAEPDRNAVQTFKARYSQDPPTENDPWVRSLKDGGRLIVDQFYRNAQATLKVRPAAPEDPSATSGALRVILTGIPMQPAQELSEWLFSKNSPFGPSSVSLGPAKFSFVEETVLTGLPAVSAPEGAGPAIGKLQLTFKDGQNVEFPVPDASEEEREVPGTPYRIKVLRYLPDARVAEGRLESRSNEPLNPALEFKIFGSKWEETHLVFSQFPDLEGVHGRSQAEVRVKARFVSAGAAASPGLRGELILALHDDKTLVYRVRTKGVLGEPKRIIVGEEVPLGWMTLRFKVAEAYPRAVASFQYRKVAVPAGKSGPPPAIHFKIEREGLSTETWLEQGDMREMALGGVPYLVRYGLRAHPLGFQLTLKKFHVGKYAGTNSPSSFESFVHVKNDKTGEDFETKVHMNHPLKYEGYTFFQSSYQEGGGPQDPFISIFSVARDPGTPVKYAGAILMVGGIALMFWFKPLFVQKRMQAKKREDVGVVSTRRESVPCETT